jgi:hypothetical protein
MLWAKMAWLLAPAVVMAPPSRLVTATSPPLPPLSALPPKDQKSPQLDPPDPPKPPTLWA